MNLLKPISVIFLSVMLAACMDAHRSGKGETESSGSESGLSDTILHTFPVNYMGALDTMNASKLYEISSYKDMLVLYEKLNYTPEAWQAGIREVPRVYLTIIGERWGSASSKEVTVENKKRLFFRGLAPMILRANELILKDRVRLEKVRSGILQDQMVSEYDSIWIMKLAGLYKVSGELPLTAAMLEELWERVDMVPPSLALAQGAEESGWGTSRFAAEGNAIYGQWTWGKNAIVPEQQRKELGNYGIAAFESLQESVCAYMLNLNTHAAYADLRAKRAALRKSGQKITGTVLSEQLTRYSERGEDYVRTLKTLMEYNRLEPTDDAYLSDDPPLYLVPSEERLD
jgi:uncharacterized FlgJ-related protein